jgi:monoamine oxidase
VESCGILLQPLRLADLVNSQFWLDRFYQAEEYEWQPTLFQPVHGMDRIWAGFLRTPIGKLIRYKREVVSISNLDHAKIKVRHRAAGSSEKGEEIIADWCISTIPIPILRTLDTNFPDDFKKAIATLEFARTCKVGWQASSRFWETEDQMYGGISYIKNVEHPITQMWYPSYGYFGKKGILTGAYNYDDDAARLAALGIKERLQFAMAGAQKLHPDFAQHVPIELGLSIAWKQVPYQLGGWMDDWSCDDTVYERLLKPVGQFWVAGDQASYLSGWQEGAVRSAHHVIAGIAGVKAPPLKKVAPALRKPPSIRRRTRG